MTPLQKMVFINPPVQMSKMPHFKAEKISLKDKREKQKKN